MTLKQKLGRWLIPKLPFNSHVFRHFRNELNAGRVRFLCRIYLPWIIKLKRLKEQKNILGNIACGPSATKGFVNVDLYLNDDVDIVFDCRKKLPFSDSSCKGIHVEHFLEHLEPNDELPIFLQECYRSLQKDGVLRIIVPDAYLYIRAYLSEGWDMLEDIGCGGSSAKQSFPCKIEVLNHIFIQGYEHFGGFDEERLKYVISQAGFNKINRCNWRQGEFPGGCIDREQHKPYSIYFEAVK